MVAGHSDENFANIAGPRFADAFDAEMRRLTGREPAGLDDSETDGDDFSLGADERG